MAVPTFERGEQIALLGVLSGFFGSNVAWSGAAPQLLVAPTGSRLVVLVVVTLVGIIILLRPWEFVEQLLVAGGGGLVLGITGQSAVGLVNAVGTAPGLGVYLTLLGGVGLLLGGGLDFLASSSHE